MALCKKIKSEPYAKRPVIQRYSGVTPRPGNFHQGSYMYNRFKNGEDGKTVVKELPRKKVPGKEDPYPDTKELPPYHHPTPSPTPKYDHHDILAPTEPTPKYLRAKHHSPKPTATPPPPYYPDRPDNFDPLLGPSPFVDEHVGELQDKYKVKLSTNPDALPDSPHGNHILPGVPRFNVSYVQTDDYRQSGYAPPKKAYLPPPLPPGRKGKSGRQFELGVTKFPPPSSGYEPPWLP